MTRKEKLEKHIKNTKSFIEYQTKWLEEHEHLRSFSASMEKEMEKETRYLEEEKERLSRLIAEYNALIGE